MEALRRGEVIGLPTDTVYGLAARAADRAATERIFELKRRPAGVVLPVLVADLEQALDLADDIPPVALDWMNRHWPGPLTVVLRRRAGLGFHLGGDDATIGLRVPDHPLVRDVCRAVGPLATTSANRHGEPPLTSADAVRATFADDLPVVVDGGECDGEPSTVVDATEDRPRVLRVGALDLGLAG